MEDNNNLPRGVVPKSCKLVTNIDSGDISLVLCKAKLMPIKSKAVTETEASRRSGNENLKRQATAAKNGKTDLL